MTIESTCRTGTGTLLCWRDSFGNSLYPYLAQRFEKATFLRASSYDLTKLGEADTVIIELVERNIPRLVQNAPVFPAPVRKVAAETSGDARIAVTITGEEELVNVTAELGRELYDFGGSVYILVDGTAYEACVMYPEGSSAALATAWLPAGENREVRILCAHDGKLTEYSAQ